MAGDDRAVLLPTGAPYMLVANLDESIANCLTWDLYKKGMLKHFFVVRGCLMQLGGPHAICVTLWHILRPCKEGNSHMCIAHLLVRYLLLLGEVVTHSLGRVAGRRSPAAGAVHQHMAICDPSPV